AQAPHRGRPPRKVAGGDRTLGWYPGPRGGQGGDDAAVLPLRYHPNRVRGWRLHRHTDRLGQTNVPLHGRGGQTHRPTPIQGPTQALDRRENLCLAELVAPLIQRLRTTPQLSRNHDLHRLRTPAATTSH